MFLLDLSGYEHDDERRGELLNVSILKRAQCDWAIRKSTQKYVATQKAFVLTHRIVKIVLMRLICIYSMNVMAMEKLLTRTFLTLSLLKKLRIV